MKELRNPPLPEHYLAHARELRRRQTDAEQLMWRALRGRRFAGCKFRRQFAVAGYVLDFYCHELGLAIELDGSQHQAMIECDERRSSELLLRGIYVLRFWNHQVLGEPKAVLAVIWNEIGRRKPSPHPDPLPGGEGELKNSQNLEE